MGMQQLHADLIFEECFRLGIRDVFVGSGSRSSPLVLAAAKHPGFQTHLIVDERSLAFVALGVVKAFEKPTIVITTSGSAVLNAAPAIAEADQSALPLFLISADRPEHLHNVGANQTMPQQHILKPFVRVSEHFQLDLLSPETILKTVDALYIKAMGPLPGPIHLNIAMDEPLHDVNAAAKPVFRFKHPDLEKWQVSKLPFQFSQNKKEGLPDHHLLKDFFKNKQKVLIVVGEIALDQQVFLKTFLDKNSKIPVIAEAQSGQLGLPQLCYYHQQYLAENPPDAILQFGGRLVSKTLEKLKLSNTVAWLHIDSRPRVSNLGHNNAHCFVLDFSKLDAFFNQMLQLEDTYLKSLQGLADLAAKQLHLSKDAAFIQQVLKCLPSHWQLFIGNSLPIRQVHEVLDKALPWQTLWANRGVSGIEGTTATAAGVALATQKETLLLTGDLSFCYDLHILKFIAEKKIPLKIIVINNGGGAIFERLPLAQNNPYFETYFKASHSLRFEKIAQQFGLSYLCDQIENIKLESVFETPFPAVFELIV